jgi:hypothetical protein
MACRCGGHAGQTTRSACRRANSRLRSALRMVMACRCGGHAGRATRSACRRANGRFRSALHMATAPRCGRRPVSRGGISARGEPRVCFRATRCRMPPPTYRSRRRIAADTRDRAVLFGMGAPVSPTQHAVQPTPLARAQAGRELLPQTAAFSRLLTRSVSQPRPTRSFHRSTANIRSLLGLCRAATRLGSDGCQRGG